MPPPCAPTIVRSCAPSAQTWSRIEERDRIVAECIAENSGSRPCGPTSDRESQPLTLYGRQQRVCGPVAVSVPLVTEAVGAVHVGLVEPRILIVVKSNPEVWLPQAAVGVTMVPVQLAPVKTPTLVPHAPVPPFGGLQPQEQLRPSVKPVYQLAVEV